jgi:hypothetical protein
MTSEKSRKTDQSKGQLEGNLGQKEAQVEKEKDAGLSHMGEKSSEAKKKST